MKKVILGCIMLCAAISFSANVCYAKYDAVGSFQNGYALIQLDSLIGLINENGKEVIPPKYRWIEFLSIPDGGLFGDFFNDEKNDSEYVKVMQNNLYGIIHKVTGKEIISPQFSNIKMLSSRLFVVSQKDGWRSKYGLFDTDGKEKLPCVYDKIEYLKPLSTGLATAELNREYGVINSDGTLITPVQYTRSPTFTSSGLLQVHIRHRTGAINTTGKEVIPVIYDDLKLDVKDDNDFIAAEVNGKWGYINRKGKEKIAFLYDDASCFSEELAAVKLKIKKDEIVKAAWGYIDKTGKMVIEPQYDVASSFCEGLAGVGYGSAYELTDNKYGFIDKNGKEAITMKYTNLTDFSEGLAGVEIDGKWGFIDKTGNLVIPNKYALILSLFEKSVAKVKIIDGSVAYIDLQGNEYKSKAEIKK